MLKIAIFMLLLTLLLNPFFAQAPAKTTLALMDLNATGISKTEAILLTEALRSYLSNTNYFDIVEPSKLDEILKRDKILREYGLASSGAGEETGNLVEAGRYLSVQKMIGGSIGKLGNTWMLNIRLIDVNSGMVEKACSKDYKGEKDQLLVYMNTIAQEIVAAVDSSAKQVEAIRKKAIADSAAAAEADQARLAAESEAKRLEEQQRLRPALGVLLVAGPGFNLQRVDTVASYIKLKNGYGGFGGVVLTYRRFNVSVAYLRS